MQLFRKRGISMAYKIAVASSDGVHIDGHFGSATDFYILQVQDDGSYEQIEKRVIKEENTSENTADAAECGSKKKDCNCSSKPQGGGCGGGHSDPKIERKVNAISDCRCLLVLKCGPGAERQLQRKAISTFQIDVTVAEALEKIIPYFEKTDKHISLRKAR